MIKRTRCLLLTVVMLLMAGLVSGCFGGGSDATGTIEGQLLYREDPDEVVTRGLAARTAESSIKVVPRLQIEPVPPQGYRFLEDARVVLEGTGRVAKTGKDGSFVITGVSAGRADLAITHQSFPGVLRGWVDVQANRTTRLTDDHFAKVHYVLIGVGSYQDRSLAGPTNDVELMRETFCAAASEANTHSVKTLIDANATTWQISKAISSVGEAMENRERDFLVLYFSGHGDNDVLVAYDGVLSDVFLKNEIIDAGIYNAAIIIDTCASGSMVDGFGVRSGSTKAKAAVPRYLSTLPGSLNGYPTRYTVLAASEANQPAWEKEFTNGWHGVFTYHLVEALKDEITDRNRDGLVSAKEAYDRVRRLLSDPDQVGGSSYTQNVVLWGAGDTVLGRIER